VGALAFSATLLLRIDAWIASRPIADVSEHYARIRAMEERRSWFGRGNPKSFMLLARHAADSGDLDTALLDYRRSIDIFETSAAYYELGRLHERREEWGPALQAYEDALALDPDSRPALKRSAAMLLLGGDEAEARERARRARELEIGASPAEANPRSDSTGY
jgi:tetratricopeptide (TPR) repeat protein